MGESVTRPIPYARRFLIVDDLEGVSSEVGRDCMTLVLPLVARQRVNHPWRLIGKKLDRLELVIHRRNLQDEKPVGRPCRHEGNSERPSAVGAIHDKVWNAVAIEVAKNRPRDILPYMSHPPLNLRGIMLHGPGDEAWYRVVQDLAH